MIKTEAKWLRAALDLFYPRIILNYGSSSLHFRTVEQPFIAEAFDGYNVVHIDQKPVEGVDIVCDISNCEECNDLIVKKIGWGDVEEAGMAVLSNMLEHTNDRDAVMWSVTRLNPKYLYVSVPHQWAYHPDPIDNNYRPSPEELKYFVERFNYGALAMKLCIDERGSVSAGVFEYGR